MIQPLTFHGSTNRDTSLFLKCFLIGVCLALALHVQRARAQAGQAADPVLGPLSPAILSTPQSPSPKQVAPSEERPNPEKIGIPAAAVTSDGAITSPSKEGSSQEGERASKDAVAVGDRAREGGAPPSDGSVPAGTKGINILELAIQGGIFMIPIAALSLLAVTMIIERLIGLRRQRVLPYALLDGLEALGNAAGGFDPRKAYRLCQQHPSAAASVVRALLLKVGRPLAEVEHTVAEASEREADRLYRNVRWLNLAAALAPLLGLLGTVQGMIIAFHQTTVLEPGQNKSILLAEGIYTALVTTFAGLVVAIPSALFSHYFEGRIQSLFHEIDELVFNLLPQIERYEGRMRFARQTDASESILAEQRTAPPAEARPAGEARAAGELRAAPESRPARAAAGPS